MYVWIAVGVLCLALGGVVVFLYQILQQQGRILLRVESLEQRLNTPAQAEPEGIPVGEALPSFRLPDVTGRMVGLEDYLGRRVLLVHWSPSCGFCDALAPELAELKEKLATAGTEVVLLSYGDVDANLDFAERHDLDFPLLLIDGSEPPQAFAGLGTPVAYLVDEEGRIAAPLAVGADAVPELARAVVEERKQLRRQRSLAESRIERDGLPPGSAAPEFELEDLEGRRISLEDYRGRHLLLVFSDPNCRPCDALAPELVRLDEQAGSDLAVVMVSRGERGENERKADEHGFSFPVVIQAGWRLSKKYGIFATPVAFLIDEEGLIAEPVAFGVDEVIRLAATASSRGKEVPAHSL